MKTVKGIRMENGITQEEMAFLLNLSTKQYRFKEQGKKWEYIRINYKEVFGDDHINFPWFEPGTKFKDLELFKNYTMETINEE